MDGWRHRAEAIMLSEGVLGAAWDAHRQELQRRGIPLEQGLSKIRRAAMPYLQRVVAFAFADGIIEQHEMDEFEAILARLGLAQDSQAQQMRQRMQRGLALSKFESGDLPRLNGGSSIYLEPTEILHFDQPAVYVRY